MELLLPVPGVSGKPWCAIFRVGDTYCYKTIGVKALRRCYERKEAELGLRVRKIMAMCGAMLCHVAYTKEGKEVLLLCNPAAGSGGCEVLPECGMGSVGNVGSWGLVTMSNDKVVVIEGGKCGSHAVAVYEFKTQAWRVLCEIPAEMVIKYSSSIHRFPSVVLGHFLYILVLLPDGVQGTRYKIAALDFRVNEWAEFGVITPRTFTRIRLVGVHGRLLLVGLVQEGGNATLNVDDSYVIMDVVLSTTTPTVCVEVSEMPGGFCAALADAGSVFKFKAVVCGYDDFVFFVSSQGKPVVYSTVKNAWSYVPVFSRMHLPNHGSDNYIHSDGCEEFEKREKEKLQTQSVQVCFKQRDGQSVAGRPPRWRNCQQPHHEDLTVAASNG